MQNFIKSTKRLSLNYMIQLVLKNNIKKDKIDALLHFLKSWDVDVEVKVTRTAKAKKKSKEFLLSEGIWKDYDIDASDLRKQAWKIST